MTLYAHQKRFLSKNLDKSALIHSCGLGKTRTAIEWAKSKSLLTLVIVPKFLKTNWNREIGNDRHWFYVISKEEFRKSWKLLPRFSQVIVDECFPAGTKVLTPSGYKNIESINVYDKIISALGEDMVMSVMKKTADFFVVIKFSGREIRVTENHPLFTDRGWVLAGKLKSKDVLLHYGYINDMLIAYDLSMQTLQKESSSKYFFGISQRQGKILSSNIPEKKFLQQQLSDEISLEKKPREIYESFAFGFDKQGSFRTDEKEKSYEKQEVEREVSSDIIANGSQTESVGGKWKGDASSPESFTFSSRRGMVWRAYCYYRKIKVGISQLLQDRYCQSEKENCDRSRWRKSLFSSRQKKGQEEDQIFRGFRVESIEIQEQKDTPVFNIGVVGHPSYVVEDILVHNCHAGFLTPHFKSQMSKALRSYLKVHKIPRLLALSATPFTSSPWNIFNLAYYLGHKWNWQSFNNEFFDQIRMGPRIIPVPKKGCEKKLASLVKKIADVVNIEDVIDIPLQFHAEPETFALSLSQKKKIKEAYDPLPIVRFTAYHQIEQQGDKNERIIALCEENPKLAIISRYNAQIDSLASILEKYRPLIIRGDVKDRDSVCKQAENADKAVVLIQADAGLGFELPSFPLCVFASMSYSFTSYEQMCGRFLRVNSPSRTTFMYLLTEGKSVDRAIFDCIRRKKDFKIALYA